MNVIQHPDLEARVRQGRNALINIDSYFFFFLIKFFNFFLVYIVKIENLAKNQLELKEHTKLKSIILKFLKVFSSGQESEASIRAHPGPGYRHQI